MKCGYCGEEFSGDVCPRCGMEPFIEPSDIQETAPSSGYKRRTVRENISESTQKADPSKEKYFSVFGYVVITAIAYYVLRLILVAVGRPGWSLIAALIAIAFVCSHVPFFSEKNPAIGNVLELVCFVLFGIYFLVICAALGRTGLGIAVLLVDLITSQVVMDRIPKKASKVIKIAGSAFVCVVLVLLIVSYVNISAIKKGSPRGYPDIEYGEAFESFFDSPKWKFFLGADGEKVIEFTGECLYLNEDVEACIQFIRYDNNTFEPVYLAFNDMSQSDFILTALILAAFEDYNAG